MHAASHDVPGTTRVPDRDSPWAIVLAGGDGTRLLPLVRTLHGDDRPKQFAALEAGRSLLSRTLERVRRITLPERTLVVTRRDHDAYVSSALTGEPPIHVFAQPADRGTAPAILWPALWIAARDPDGIVAVFPSDHDVRDEDAFVRHLHGVADHLVPDATVLFGASARGADPGYGWIELGPPIPLRGDLFAVRSFIEKPSPDEARGCFERGDLWNTLVLVSRARTLASLAARALPAAGRALGPIGPLADGTHPAVVRAYAACPTADFSRHVLARASRSLIVSRLPFVGWSDWGTPERVLQSFADRGVRPEWARGPGRDGFLVPGTPSRPDPTLVGAEIGRADD